jgi:formylglycine-generating enzyme
MPRNRILAFVLIILFSTIGVGADHLIRAAETKVITNSINMKLVEIPAGEFLMGAEETSTTLLKKYHNCDPDWINAELPQHSVRITNPFFIGQYEVTLNQFLKFYYDAKYKLEAELDGKPSWGFDKDGNMVESTRFRPWETVAWKIDQTHPVIYVTWNDAVAFCEWLSEKEGKTYRLPTEAEWEYACRAGTTKRYSFGDEPEQLFRFANSADSSRLNALYPKSPEKKIRALYLIGSDGFVWTSPSGKFQPNGFGLYDMHGNVWEWCSDWFDENYYGRSATDDPTGPLKGTTRVLRGGGFYDASFHLRCARRNSDLPTSRDYGNGFRVVRER